MSGKRWFAGIFTILFGLVAFAGGVSDLMSSEVDCGGSAMSSTDTCVTVDDSQTTESTIEQQQRGNNVMSVGVLALALGVIVFGVLVLRKGARLKKAAQAGLQQPPHGALHPHPGQHLQQPGQHPQVPGAWQHQPGFPPQQTQSQQDQQTQPPTGYRPNG